MLKVPDTDSMGSSSASTLSGSIPDSLCDSHGSRDRGPSSPTTWQPGRPSAPHPSLQPQHIQQGRLDCAVRGSSDRRKTPKRVGKETKQTKEVPGLLKDNFNITLQKPYQVFPHAQVLGERQKKAASRVPLQIRTEL